VSRAAAWALLAVVGAGCGARTELASDEEAGSAASDPGGERGGRCEVESPDDDDVVVGTLRDLRDTHPDFEAGILSDDRGIVEAVLGEDGTPVYAGGPAGTTTTRGPEAFHAWFHDVPGENLAMSWSAPLVQSFDSLLFSSDAFFPLDGELFGNEGRAHNFHFTLEAHTSFVYAGNEILTFGGDDDLFAFIDGHLVIDLGGVHGRQSATVDVDVVAASLGLVKGERYALDLFFAERHTTASTFTLELTRFRCIED
jgi:fibro-slime domain-containing protein